VPLAGGNSTWTSSRSLVLAPAGTVIRTITIETLGSLSQSLARSTPAFRMSSTSFWRYHDGGASTPVLSSPTTSPTPSSFRSVALAM
jgi:hypothetical protein